MKSCGHGILLLVAAMGMGFWPGPCPAQTDTDAGQLTVLGEHIVSVTLEDGQGRITALLAFDGAAFSVQRSTSAGPEDSPKTNILVLRDGTVSLAPGRYRWNTAIVADPNGPKRFVARNQDKGWIDLSAGQTLTLALGGPLRHDLDVSRTGPLLVCSYRLLGSGQESYQPMTSSDARSPAQSPPAPGLTISTAGQPIHSGSFRYG